MEHWPGIRFALITLIVLVLVLVLAGKQSKSLSVVVEILRGRRTEGGKCQSGCGEEFCADEEFHKELLWVGMEHILLVRQ